MRASFIDLGRKASDVLDALDRNETVTVLYRGRPKAIMRPLGRREGQRRASEHAAFGLWRNRTEMEDVPSYVKRLRRGRFDAL